VNRRRWKLQLASERGHNRDVLRRLGSVLGHGRRGEGGGDARSARVLFGIALCHAPGTIRPINNTATANAAAAATNSITATATTTG